MNWHLHPARPDDAAALSALAMRSKAVWGYDDAFMNACRDELTVTPSEISAAGWRCGVASIETAMQPHLIGFYLLTSLSATTDDLEALFVAPDWMGRGIGRALMLHALDGLRRHRISGLEIQSDPGAVGFYRRMGARLTGERPSSSIAGRNLPVLRIEI